MWKEFKEFAVKGNAIDLAVGVIIGAAFGKIVTSIVEDLLMPPLGRVLGNLNFADYYIPLSDKITPGMSLDAAKKAGLPVFAYGNFITVLINFLIVAFCIFLVVKAINKLKRPSPSAAPVAKDCPACTMSIPIKATRCPHCTSDLSGRRAPRRIEQSPLDVELGGNAVQIRHRSPRERSIHLRNYSRSTNKIRFGVQSQIRPCSRSIHSVPGAHGENAGKIQQPDSCTSAGNFNRSPAPSCNVAAG